MTATTRTPQGATPGGAASGSGARRWVCGCRQPAVLLATYDRDGRVHIKVRDRYWHVSGRVEATCPRCGAVHLLDSTSASAAGDPAR
jgi:hypothetical protein